MKKILYNFLKKRIKNPRKYNYYFYRWIIDSVINKEEVNDVIRSISYWMTKDDYKSRLSTYLTDIFVMNNDIYLYTRRPGLWIGKCGSNIDDLVHSVNFNINDERIHNYKIEIIEDTNSNTTNLVKWVTYRYNNY